MKHHSVFAFAAVTLYSVLALGQAAETGAAATTNASATAAAISTATADRMTAGATVRVPDATAGDLLAAGGRVEVAAPVGGDAVLAGGELRVGGPLARNVYVAGGRVQLDGDMARNLRAAGGQVELASGARLAGNATIAGGDVSVRGPIKGSLSIVAGRALIDSAVEGDVNVTAGQVELGPQARIAGALRWRSQEQLQRHPSAQVAGPVERLAPVARTGDSRGGPVELHDRTGGLGPTWWTVGLMLVAAAVLGLVPEPVAMLAQTWQQRSGASLLAGFVALVCIPVAVVLLFVTVIGLPLALLVLLLYLVLLPLGYVGSAIGLGLWGLARWRPQARQRLAWQVGASSLVLVALALLGEVPWLGGFVVLAALLAGLGAIVLQCWPHREPLAR